MQAYKICLAELIAAFGLTFIGAGAICANGSSQAGIVGIAFAHGLALMCMVYATAHISGGHANPAVTFSMFITKQITAGRMVLYIVSQLIGASFAGYLLLRIFPGIPAHLGSTALASGVSPGTGILVEAVLTFFLVFTIFGVAVDRRAAPSIYGLAIGSVLVFDIIMGGAITGASMNPARSFGPALLSGYWTNHLVYWIGPLAGGGIAGLVYKCLLMDEK